MSDREPAGTEPAFTVRDRRASALRPAVPQEPAKRTAVPPQPAESEPPFKVTDRRAFARPPAPPQERVRSDQPTPGKRYLLEHPLRGTQPRVNGSPPFLRRPVRPKTQTVRPAPAPAPAPLPGEERARTPIPKAVKTEVWKRDEGRCRNCRITDHEAMLRDGEHLHFDHIRPWSLNGGDTVKNIQLLCGRCNRAKAARFGAN